MELAGNTSSSINCTTELMHFSILDSTNRAELHYVLTDVIILFTLAGPAKTTWKEPQFGVLQKTGTEMSCHLSFIWPSGKKGNRGES